MPEQKRGQKSWAARQVSFNLGEKQDVMLAEILEVLRADDMTMTQSRVLNRAIEIAHAQIISSKAV